MKRLTRWALGLLFAAACGRVLGASQDEGDSNALGRGDAGALSGPEGGEAREPGIDGGITDGAKGASDAPRGCTECSGTCTSEGCSETLVGDASLVQILAVGGGRVAFMAWNTLESVSTAGGAVVTLAADAGSGGDYGIAADGQNVYWTNWGLQVAGQPAVGGAVMSAPIAGGPLVTLANNLGFPDSLAVTSGALYWANYSSAQAADAAVLALPDGKNVAVLASHLVPPPSNVGVDSKYVYWTNDYGIQRVPLDGGVPSTIIANASGANYIALDDANIYWSNAVAGTISSVPKGGGDVVTLVAPSDVVISDLLVLDGWVYFTGDQGLSRVAASGGETELLAGSYYAAPYIATDGTSLYWAEQNYGGYGSSVLKFTMGCGCPTDAFP
jgi:hypothetical protein